MNRPLPDSRDDVEDRPARRAMPWSQGISVARKVAPWLLALVVGVLLVRQVHTIDWPQARRALVDLPVAMLVIAAVLTGISHLLVASYDLIGRYRTGHGLGLARTLRIAAICYAFNLNLGSLVGALALKLRLYTGVGVRDGTAGRVIANSIGCNWLGYTLAGGAVLAFATPPAATQWPLSITALRWLGAAMLAAVASYVAVAGLRGGRSFVLRGHTIELPGLKVALWQATVSGANWALMSVIVWVLLQQRVDYPVVLGVLLLAAVAGVVTHIPAGLGVIEAVFLVCLESEVPQATLLAALIAYRAVYYLLPLALATAGYVGAEASWRRDAALLE